MHRLLLVVAISGLVLACGVEDGHETIPDDDTETADAVSLAVADLAEHLGVDTADIEVVRQEEVVWRDGSLGCPEEGGRYTQALVDGYRIVLRAEGREYHYHGATGEEPFLCEHPQRDGTADPRQ